MKLLPPPQNVQVEPIQRLGKRLRYMAFGAGLLLQLVGFDSVHAAAQYPAAVSTGVVTTEVAGASNALIPSGQPKNWAWDVAAISGGLLLASLIGLLLRNQRHLLRLRTERDTALAQAETASADADAARQAKDEFVAILSHELRTPLQSILGWAQLLKRSVESRTLVSPESMLAPVNTVERNARSLAAVIDDLLDVSQAVAGQASLSLDHVNLAEPLQAALGDVRRSAREKDVDLQLSLPDEALWLVGDRDRLQQIVFNLIDNAVKFTPGGGTVWVSAEVKGTQLEVRVRDTGIGIAPDMLPRIFDRYFQCSVSTHRRYGGLGLGLAIVRHFVDLHGGRVEALSGGQGCGAEFILQFNAMTAESPPLQPIAKPPASSTKAAVNRRLEGLRVLVVDDDTDVRMVLDTLLGDEGAEVVTAASAEEGFECLRRERMDLILSDIGMPNTDGYVLARAVRGFGNAFSATPPTTPMIALTAFSRLEDERRALDSGFNAHLGKPVDVERLIEVLGEQARRAAQRQIEHPNVRQMAAAPRSQQVR